MKKGTPQVISIFWLIIKLWVWSYVYKCVLVIFSVSIFHVIFWLLVWLQRITIAEILEDEWFKKGYKPPQFHYEESSNVDDVDAAFNNSKVTNDHF